MTSEDLVKGLQQLQMTKVRKFFLDFEVSISNRPVFCADRGSAIESPEKRLFWTPEGCTFWPPEGQNFKQPFLDQFRPEGAQNFFDTYYESNKEPRL